MGMLDELFGGAPPQGMSEQELAELWANLQQQMKGGAPRGIAPTMGAIPPGATVAGKQPDMAPPPQAAQPTATALSLFTPGKPQTYQRNVGRDFFDTLGGSDPRGANATISALMEKGMAPNLAEAIARNPNIASHVLPTVFGGNKMGMNPVYGTDEDGNITIGQLTPQGNLHPTRLPEGWKPSSKNLIKVDAGTHFEMIDPITKAVIQRIPKDVEGAAAAKKEGEALGTARADLPTALAVGDRMVKQIEALEKEPGLDSVIGGIQGLLPEWMHTESMAGAQSKIDQAKGGAFLEAFKTLKGGGQITEIEGSKATDALARLTKQTVSEPEYRAALLEFKNEVKSLMELAKRKAAAGRSAAPPGAAPTSTSPPGSFRVLGVR